MPKCMPRKNLPWLVLAYVTRQKDLTLISWALFVPMALIVFLLRRNLAMVTLVRGHCEDCHNDMFNEAYDALLWSMRQVPNCACHCLCQSQTGLVWPCKPSYLRNGLARTPFAQGSLGHCQPVPPTSWAQQEKSKLLAENTRANSQKTIPPDTRLEASSSSMPKLHSTATAAVPVRPTPP